MRQRKQKMLVLNQDLIKYSKNIGIPETEIPNLVWEKRTFAKMTNRRKKSYSTLGACSFTTNTILVDIEIRGLGLVSAKDTLIHELVHMRWQKKPHGKSFNELIKKIKRGAIFPVRTAKDEQPYYRKDLVDFG